MDSLPSSTTTTLWPQASGYEGIDVARLYRDPRAFRYVWASLRRLGVAPHLVEDATQDVFIVVLRRGGDFRGESKVTTWLYGIARRVASDYRRDAMRHNRRVELLEQDPCAPKRTGLGSLAQLEARELLRQFVAGLDDAALEQFIVCEMEERSTREASQILGVSQHALAKARRRLRDELATIRDRAEAEGEGKMSLRRLAKALRSGVEAEPEPNRQAHRRCMAAILPLVPLAATPVTSSMPDATPSAGPSSALGPALAGSSSVAAPITKAWAQKLGATGLGAAKVALAGGLLLAGAAARPYILPDSEASPARATTARSPVQAGSSLESARTMVDAQALEARELAEIADSEGAGMAASAAANSAKKQATAGGRSRSRASKRVSRAKRSSAPNPAVASAPAKVPPRATKSVEKTNAASSTLSQQVAAVDAIRKLVAQSRYQAALTGIARYRRNFPGGTFSRVLAVVEVDAMCKSGQTARARVHARRFAARHPDTVESRKIMDVCRDSNN